MPLSINSKDLNAVTTGNGPAHDAQGFTVFTMHSQTSAGITAGAIAIQVSPDNTNWANAITPRTLAASTNAVDTVTLSARFVRVSITTTVTGGTVTVWLDATGPLPNDAGWSG